MDLIVRPHIMSDRETTVTRDVPIGSSIAEIIRSLEGVDERVRELNLIVAIDGDVVPRDLWNEIKITGREELVEIAAVLKGGKGGKQILGLIAIIALAYFSGGASLALTGEGGALAGIASQGMVQAGIMMVGSMAINAIFAPPKVDNTASDKANGSNAYTFSNQNNQARQFGPVMRIYGKHRVRPDIAAVPYTMNIGDDTYFYCIYSFGYGPVKTEDFKIGQNPLTNYKDYEIKIHELFNTSAQLEIYKQDIWQDAYNAEITKATPVQATTRPFIDEAIVDVVFIQGLAKVNDSGGPDQYTTDMTVEYQEQGTSQWFPALMSIASAGVAAHSVSGSLLGAETTQPFYYDAEGGVGAYSVMMLASGATAATVSSWGYYTDGPNVGQPLPPAPPGTALQIGPYSMTINTSSSNFVSFTTALPGQLTADGSGAIGFQYNTAASGGSASNATGNWHMSDAKLGGFIASVDIKFPHKGTWVVRISKVEADPPDTENRTLWKRSLVALKSLKNVPPLEPEVPLTIVELKIKATGQLNGSVEEFSALATSKLRAWDGVGWPVVETRNPAWIYLDLLTGTANRRPLADSRIDMDMLKTWAVKCNAVTSPFIGPMGTCDIIIDKAYTLWELLQSVGTTGRAAPTMRDNKYSVLIDDSTRVPVQMFTPRNSSGLRSTRTYVDEPHALRVKWIDPESNYGPAEITVYNTGRDENNATAFEELATFGMTRVEQVTRYGRYMLAQGKLRQERFTLDSDIENIICLRGDMVLVAHDVIEVGGEASRIQSIAGQVLTLDTPPSLVDGIDPAGLGVRIRKNNGQLTGVLNITSYSNLNQTITLQSAVPAGVNPGDLLVSGIKTAVTGNYIVDSVRPNSDMGATISLEEYAPAVYDAESTGSIPPYVPQGGGAATGPAPQNFTVSVLEFIDDAVFPRCTVFMAWAPPEGSDLNPPIGYRGWAISPDGTETYMGQTTALSYVDGPIDLWRVGGQPRIYRIRAVYDNGGMSMPAEASVILPVREPSPPIAVETFDVVDHADGMRKYLFGYPSQPTLEWLAGVEVRYVAGTIASPVWESMTPVLAPYFTQNGLEISNPPGQGPFTFAAKSVDVRGTRSVTAKVVQRTLTLSSHEQAATAGTGDPTPPPTPTNFTVTPGLALLFVTVDVPVYTMGGGHDHTNIYGVVYTGGALPTFAQARLLGTVSGNTAAIAAEPGSTYRLWAKYVTRNGVASVIPAGGTNGLAVTTGQDPSKLLAILTGQITESQLYTSLNSRINLVDGTGPGSVTARDQAIFNTLNTTISTETVNRQTETGALQSRYTVKIDSAGYVTGYGLALDVNNGVPVSSFIVRADTFAVGGVGFATSQAQIPFIVRSVGVFIGGQFVPPGAYIRDAFIQNGTINSAMIGDAVITTAKIGSLQVGTSNIANSAITEVFQVTSTGSSVDLPFTIASNDSRVVVFANSGTSSITTGDAEGGAIVIRPAHGDVMYLGGSVLTVFGVNFKIFSGLPAGGYNLTLTRATGTPAGWTSFVDAMSLLVQVLKK